MARHWNLPDYICNVIRHRDQLLDDTSADNGAAARKAAPGDLLIIATFASYDEIELEKFEPDIIHVDARNRIMNKKNKIPVQMAG